MSVIRKVSLSSLTAAIALITVFSIIISQAFFYKIHLDFFPLNGAYQTFNPVKRLLDGEIPSVDFSLYLGIGTTSLIALLASLTGADYSAVNFSNHFLHFFCHFLALLALFYLCGSSLLRSLLYASGVIEIATLVFPGRLSLITHQPFQEFIGNVKAPFTTLMPIFQIWYTLTAPGLSNLGLRSALPFLTSLAVLLEFHYLRAKPIWLAAFWGVLIGIQPLWSNDYGFISCFVLALTLVVFILKQEHSPKREMLLTLGISSVAGFLGVATVVTRGHVNNWITENLLGVAKDQFWYFEFAPNKVFSLSKIIPEPFLYYYGGALALLAIYILFLLPNIKYSLLIYIALTTFGAAILSSVGGAASIHYFIPTFLVAYFVLAFCFLLLLRSAVSLILKNITVADRVTAIKNNSILKTLLKQRLLLPMLALYIAGIVVTIDRVPAIPKRDQFYIDQLGGWLPSGFSRGVEIAQTIKAETKNLEPQRKMLSTYASLIDTLASSKNATGVDYIIHALGENTRQRYVDRYRSAMPRYITTLRQSFTAWEPWVSRANWWFYREFVRQYKPVDATFYNIIWRRSEREIELPNIEITCTIKQEKQSLVKLEISSNKQIVNNAPRSNPYYVDVTLDYSLNVKSTGVPFIGDRGLINVSEGSLKYGIPPHHENWHIPVVHQLGETSTVDLVAYPQKRATLNVASCKAQLSVPTSLFEIKQQFTAQNFTNVNWKNGIATNVLNEQGIARAGFLLDQSVPSTLVLPGMLIEFAHSGIRDVISYSGSEVWVSGAPLDPIQDGYPKPIKWMVK